MVEHANDNPSDHAHSDYSSIAGAGMLFGIFALLISGIAFFSAVCASIDMQDLEHKVELQHCDVAPDRAACFKELAR